MPTPLMTYALQYCTVPSEQNLHLSSQFMGYRTRMKKFAWLHGSEIYNRIFFSRDCKHGNSNYDYMSKCHGVVVADVAFRCSIAHFSSVLLSFGIIHYEGYLQREKALGSSLAGLSTDDY